MQAGRQQFGAQGREGQPARAQCGAKPQTPVRSRPPAAAGRRTRSARPPRLARAALRTAAPAARRPRARRRRRRSRLASCSCGRTSSEGSAAHVGGSGQPGAALRQRRRREGSGPCRCADARPGEGRRPAGSSSAGRARGAGGSGAPSAWPVEGSRCAVSRAAANTAMSARASTRPAASSACHRPSCRSTRSTRALPCHSIPGSASHDSTRAAGRTHAAAACQTQAASASTGSCQSCWPGPSSGKPRRSKRCSSTPVRCQSRPACSRMQACCRAMRTPARDSRDSRLSSGEVWGASMPAGRPDEPAAGVAAASSTCTRQPRRARPAATPAPARPLPTTNAVPAGARRFGWRAPQGPVRIEVALQAFALGRQPGVPSPPRSRTAAGPGAPGRPPSRSPGGCRAGSSAPRP